MLHDDVSIGSDAELSSSNPSFLTFFYTFQKTNFQKFWKQIFKN